MIKRAAIIGSNGYLGRNMALYLKNAGTVLFCYDIQDKSFFGNCEYHQLDIANCDQVSIVNLNVDAVFIFAGITGTEQSFLNYENYIDVNVKGLLNILTHVKESKSKARIVFPSSRLVYKGQKDTPLNEDSEKEARTIYAATKITCENLLYTYSEVFGISYNVFRVCVPYGNLFPGDTSYGTIGFFMNKARSGNDITLFGGGELKRTFTHISDLCKIIVDTISLEETKNKIFNVGGETYSLKEVAHLIAEKYSVGIEFKSWPEFALKIESGDTIFDDSKIRLQIDSLNVYDFKRWLEEDCQ